MFKQALIRACLLVPCVSFAVCAGETFYINPHSSAALWVKAHPDDPRAAKIRTAIADVPGAQWLTGTSQSTASLSDAVRRYSLAAQQQHKTPVFVAYNLPDRDCSGGASAGGAANGAEYRMWIDQMVNGLGDKPAVLILEPDALADIECLTPAKRAERLDLMRYAVDRSRQHAPATDVYLDAGNANWKPAATMAASLNAAGIKNARGFALNVSNFYPLQMSRDYGDALNARLSSEFGYTRAMVIDTSRNGNGAKGGQWCNPPGRKIGVQPGEIAKNVLALWVKVPGNSDGDFSPLADCHGGPAAGVFSPDLAIRLIEGR